MPTHNALLGLLQKKAPAARNALAEIAQQPWPYTDPRAFATGMGTAPSEEAAKYGASFLPVIGDAVGLAQDVGGYIQDPNSLTPLSGLLTLAAMAPGIPAAGHAKKGGEVAKANGYFYKGGQFLPSTPEAPGKYRVGGKLVKRGKTEVAPGQYEFPPSATAESLYKMAAPGAWTRRNRDTGQLEFVGGVRDALGNAVTPEMAVSKNGHTLQEVIEAYNSGQRWLDNGS